MKERRQNSTTRTRYNVLSKCLYECKGQENGCKFYARHKDTCMWYDIIQKDIIKIKNKEDSVTFGLLEKILEDTKIRKKPYKLYNNLYERH